MPVTAILYIIVYFGGIAASFLLDVSWGVCLYEIQYFFYPESRWWHANIPGFFSSFLISIIIIIAYALNREEYRATSLNSAPQTKWLIALFLLMCTVGFYALSPERHWEYVISHFKLLLIMSIAYKVIDSPVKFERMVFFYLLGVFYLGWEAFSVGRSSGGRLEGIGSVDGQDANDTAAAMITAIPVLFYYLMNGKKWQQALAFISMAFIVNGVILINSRGAFLGIITAFIYICSQIFFKSRDKIKRYRFKTFLFIVFAAGLFFYLADSLFWARMATLVGLEESIQAGNTPERLYFWIKAIGVAMDYPMGTGVMGFQILSPQFLPEEMLTQGMRAVHSTPFQVLAEYGFLGFFLFLRLLMSNFSMLKDMKRYFLSKGEVDLFFKTVSIEAGFIAFMTASFFIDRYYAVVFYWIMLFIACFHNSYFLKTENT